MSADLLDDPQPAPDSRKSLIFWLSTVDLDGFSTAALQAAYDALVDDDGPADGDPA